MATPRMKLLVRDLVCPTAFGKSTLGMNGIATRLENYIRNEIRDALQNHDLANALAEPRMSIETKMLRCLASLKEKYPLVFDRCNSLFMHPDDILEWRRTSGCPDPNSDNHIFFKGKRFQVYGSAALERGLIKWNMPRVIFDLEDPNG